MAVVTKLPDLNLGQPLPGVSKNYYSEISRYLEELRKQEQAEKPEGYDTIKFTIANYLYLIHERLNLEKFREVDYDQVQNFATKNKDLIRYLFEKKFPQYPVEALNTWIEPSIDIFEAYSFPSFVAMILFLLSISAHLTPSSLIFSSFLPR